MHPRNRHQGHYDFAALTQALPELRPHVVTSPRGEATIDFASPEAVKALNRALLKVQYGIHRWDVPRGYLCPAVPGRADHIHALADLLAESRGGEIPRGDAVRVLDIGVGANCIYPIVGRAEYGWSFVGVDTDPVALKSAEKIVNDNPVLKGGVTFRLQTSYSNVFKLLVRDGDRFDLTVCNPPFHTSQVAAQEAAERKWRQLGKAPAPRHGNKPPPALNFGGQGTELWAPGGESAFIERLARESSQIPAAVAWFSTLVSDVDHLDELYQSLTKFRVTDCRTLEIEHGQKKSRVVAWTYQNEKALRAWKS